MDVANAACTASYTAMLTVIWCYSECCVLSGLDFEATGGYIVSCLSNYCFEGIDSLYHYMGALFWLNVETLERAPAHPLP